MARSETEGGRAGSATENAISLRGTREWRDWLRRLSDHCRTTGATVIDQALAKYARDVGFDEPPPRRC
ncbi:hypothetical protein [Tautonia plasticadhaerens]|uniref:Uncharacterized protein n=1 Tax=Tautonia plasticadhaerens TaxID=2527974 RepID=A0A518GZP6_9BACT|nr:hypothetical protein [Tautonia plasticadhaerens]QDV34053.1 hypothetical protein ElP_19340 [Tautonia plasticadhaerens]